MKHPNRKPVLIIAGVLLALLAYGSSAHLITQVDKAHIVIRSSQPRIALREAQQLWEDGSYVTAIPQFAWAAVMIADSSVRWRMADVFIARSETQFDDGDAEGGFESCREAVRLLGNYDGRLMIDDACWTTYMQTVKRTNAAGGAQ